MDPPMQSGGEPLLNSFPVTTANSKGISGRLSGWMPSSPDLGLDLGTEYSMLYRESGVVPCSVPYKDSSDRIQ